MRIIAIYVCVYLSNYCKKKYEFRLCLVQLKLISGKYFMHLWIFGVTKNIGQPEIAFMLTVK